MSEWIPIADATIDKERGYYVTWRTGKVTYMHGHELRGAMLSEVAAIYPSVPTPEPYVPPAPPSPVHREWHFDGEPRAYTNGQPTLRTNAIVHAGPPVNGGLHVREVLPGDPKPEDIAKVVEDIEFHLTTKIVAGKDTLQKWLDKLTGK
jgi:hypothetical protein